MNEQLRLNNIRNVLIRLEETILFGLIERAQFRRNHVIYKAGVLGDVIAGDSLVGFLLHQTEKLHAQMRRYTSPDEHPFYRDLPEPLLPRLRFDENPLQPNSVNVNEVIRRAYEQEIVPMICRDGDDQQYGSSSTADVACLQALSKRIHYGKFVAESKFRAAPDAFRSLARAQDAAGLMRRITDEDVEKQVLDRVEIKTGAYGQSRDPGGTEVKLDPRMAVEIYRRWIIPLNKEVQVLYLLQRPLEA